jgi:hypothetical protein
MQSSQGIVAECREFPFVYVGETVSLPAQSLDGITISQEQKFDKQSFKIQDASVVA